MHNKPITLQPMNETDSQEVVRLIGDAMNADEAAWAQKTIAFHFQCSCAGMQDGRLYLVWKHQQKTRAVVGLHHYNWGPEENVWLGWFAVDPDFQGRGLGKALMDQAKENARKQGFRKLFVETYDSDDFAKAREFYTKAGFKHAGTIHNYLPDGSAMVVYRCDL